DVGDVVMAVKVGAFPLVAEQPVAGIKADTPHNGDIHEFAKLPAVEMGCGPGVMAADSARAADLGRDRAGPGCSVAVHLSSYRLPAALHAGIAGRRKWGGSPRRCRQPSGPDRCCAGKAEIPGVFCGAEKRSTGTPDTRAGRDLV